MNRERVCVLEDHSRRPAIYKRTGYAGAKHIMKKVPHHCQPKYEPGRRIKVVDCFILTNETERKKRKKKKNEEHIRQRGRLNYQLRSAADKYTSSADASKTTP
jgi:hypothetical protein